jgi:hypothetical protein
MRLWTGILLVSLLLSTAGCGGPKPNAAAEPAPQTSNTPAPSGETKPSTSAPAGENSPATAANPAPSPSTPPAPSSVPPSAGPTLAGGDPIIGKWTYTGEEGTFFMDFHADRSIAFDIQANVEAMRKQPGMTDEGVKAALEEIKKLGQASGKWTRKGEVYLLELVRGGKKADDGYAVIKDGKLLESDAKGNVKPEAAKKGFVRI